MIHAALQFYEKQLRDITSTFSEEDWCDNRATLASIRAVLSEPRSHAAPVDDPCRPKRTGSDEITKILTHILELPVNGRSTSERVEPILATSGPPEPTHSILQNEGDIVERCNNAGIGPRAIAVAKAVFRSLKEPNDTYADLWHGSNFYQTAGTTECRLLDTNDKILSEGYTNAARSRINILVFACVFHARVESLGATKKKETITLTKIEEESGKSRAHITTLLKRGRWYALWVGKLGLGAILSLGNTLATSNYMKDMDQLIGICSSIHGFRQRSRDLSELATEAIIQAILQSKGEEAVAHVPTAQRYTGGYVATITEQLESEASEISQQARATLPCLRNTVNTTYRTPEQSTSLMLTDPRGLTPQQAEMSHGRAYFPLSHVCDSGNGDASTACSQHVDNWQPKFRSEVDPHVSCEEASRGDYVLGDAPIYPVHQIGHTGTTVGDYDASEAAFTGPGWAGMSEEEWLDIFPNLSR